MSFRIFGNEYKNDEFFIRLIRSVKQRIWSLERLTIYDHNSVDVELMMLTLHCSIFKVCFRFITIDIVLEASKLTKTSKPLKMNQLIKCSTIL